jgi:hypothetical protein
MTELFQLRAGYSMSKRETISNFAEEFVTDSLDARAGDEPIPRVAIVIIGFSTIATLVWNVWIISRLFS